MRDALAALRAGWWLLLIGLIAGGGVAFGVAVAQTPVYTSSTELFFSTSNAATTSDVFQGSLFSEQRVASYARLLTGDEMVRRVSERLDIDPDDFSADIEATAVPETVLLDVTVTDPSAGRAQQIAEAIGAEFPAFVAELESAETGGGSPVKVAVTDMPDLPGAPSSPQITRSLVLGALIGLLVGAGLALLRARLDRSVKLPEDAAELAGAPVIGTVLRDDVLETQHVIVGRATSRAAEDYRQLRTNLQFLNVDEPPKVIMVSSAVPSEGKTTVVLNLGLALAEAGGRVVIVEADLRRPKVTRYLGMVAGVGLTNILAGTAELSEVVQRFGNGSLSVIAAGPTPPNPGQLLSSSHMSALIEKLRSDNDFVLVDAPPVLPVADATGLAVSMDGVLLSVRYGSTAKEQLRQAALTLDRVGANMLGVILNIVPPQAELVSAYAYGYSYGDEPDKGGRHR